MEKFIISNARKLNNFGHRIELNKNFTLHTDKKPDLLTKGKEKYLFFGKINGFFEKNKFIRLDNFRLKKHIKLLINNKNNFDGNYFFLKIKNQTIELNIDNKGLYDVYLAQLFDF